MLSMLFIYVYVVKPHIIAYSNFFIHFWNIFPEPHETLDKKVSLFSSVLAHKNVDACVKNHGNQKA